MKILFLLSAILVPILANEKDCGQSPELKAYHNGRIVGGRLVENCETIPWQILLRTEKALIPIFPTFKVSSKCGGSIIGQDTILTAAHCTVGVSLSDMVVHLQNGQKFGVVQKIEHPEYNSTSMHADMSILKLDGSIDFSTSCVQKICLKTIGQFHVENTKCTVSGYGKTNYQAYKGRSSKPMPELRMVQVRAWKGQDCKKVFQYTDTPEKPYIGNTITQICAGIPQKGHKDSCQGDSGGPLVCYDEDTKDFYQAGVVSFGWGCADEKYPGVYTNAPFFYNWIQEQLQ